jgi:hypothetical protein
VDTRAYRNSKVEKCHPSLFGHGDFVEVPITADIAQYGSRDTRGAKDTHKTIKLHCNIEGILLMCRATELPKVRYLSISLALRARSDFGYRLC